MAILLVLVPISLLLLGLAIWAFAWAVRRGQFEDLDTPALDILRDDDGPRRAPAATQAIAKTTAKQDAAAPAPVPAPASASAAGAAPAIGDPAARPPGPAPTHPSVAAGGASPTAAAPTAAAPADAARPRG